MIPKWNRCNDAAGGQDSVHQAGTKYLPMLKDQTEADYQAYKQRATFYNATWRTIVGLGGMLLRKPPKVEVPASVEPLLETITNDFQPIDVIVNNVVEEALKTGRVGLLVDYPDVDTSKLTKADAALLNLRPTLALYKAATIINWKEDCVNNNRFLSMVVLVEDYEKPVDEFTSLREDRYRVLDLLGGKYRQRIFRIKDDGTQEQVGEDMFPTMNGNTMDAIPFYIIGPDDTRIEPDEPPLIDLVDMNLAHYRVSADYEHGCHFTGLPTGWITGHTVNEGEKIYLGSQSMMILPSADAKVGFLEFTGQGLASLEKNLSSKENHMAILGARMLETQKQAAEAAKTAHIHRSGEGSVLASMARSISEGLQIALQKLSDWAGGNGVVIFELNRDFLPMDADPAELTALMGLWQGGATSKETLFDNLQKREVIADSVTFEEEEEKIMNTMNLGLGGTGAAGNGAPPNNQTDQNDHNATILELAKGIQSAVGAPITLDFPELPAPVVNVTVHIPANGDAPTVDFSNQT